MMRVCLTDRYLPYRELNLVWHNYYLGGESTTRLSKLRRVINTVNLPNSL